MVEVKVSDRVMVSGESLYEISCHDGTSQFLFKTKQPSKESGDIKAPGIMQDVEETRILYVSVYHL